ncbi:response regulator transcription factor [Porticoccus sp. W117]|uniref:response regulator n=1 Tax=Porticoccus sp. W117 TaxID=3054777 RepID=UPI002591816C|nr:response regulator transcription factor [Porticoccus sp. W117]MDM3870004.1 response regulator transcription factor [Porticoccus sp. W117]
MDTILIVDDHPLFVDGLQLMLSDLWEGVEILSAHSVKEAKAILEQNAAIDLIFLDLNMPGECGRAMLNLHAEMMITAPVIVVSEYSTPENVHQVLELGASAFLSKNLAKTQMAECLRAIQCGQIYLPPSVELALQQYRNSVLLEYRAIESVLSARQKEILVLLANGYSNADIGDSLRISESTVKSHVSKIMNLFDVDNRTACVAEAVRLGFLK